MVCISDLEEVALPLEEYASLREFFVRSLKEGSRPIDPDPSCLVIGDVFQFSCMFSICLVHDLLIMHSKQLFMCDNR